ncbi:MAG: RluA family pseudouridine synthase [Spirochaetaceae bacterium]|jgi:23S rRNA pseudouridine1911/1915/1917 synthase|nr:RluA family pseudouridine synthase [Spirochaetaceae bacterium]
MPTFSDTVCEQLSVPLRLDRYIAEYLKLFTRSQIKARAMQAFVNGKPAKLSRIVRKGDVLELSWQKPELEFIEPEDIALDLIYEDERVIVVNKRQGMVVHPGAGNRHGTLVNALLFRHKDLCAQDTFRPGIVHRLDKDTSGVIIAAYDVKALEFLAEQFKNRQVKKRYAALVAGTPKERSGRIETFISRDPRNRQRFAVSKSGGRCAVTDYRVIRSWDKYSLLLVKPRTGRTHQIRVHLKHIKHPIIGDVLYGTPDPDFSLMLHAKSLCITIPGDNAPRLFSAPLPQRFHNCRL